jgi:hypothetical protein
MPYFDRPPGERVLEEFRVFRSPSGEWRAVEIHGMPGGSFASCDEAVRFALHRADDDAARVHLAAPSKVQRG